MDTGDNKKKYEKREKDEIYERFKEELKRNNLKRADYAREELHVSLSKLDHNRSECFLPEDIKRMCKKFNCSSEYLLGITEARNHEDLDIGAVTGLSVESVHYLRKLKDNNDIEAIFLINCLIKVLSEMDSEELTPERIINEMCRYNFCEQNKWFKRFDPSKDKHVEALKKFIIEQELDIYESLLVSTRNALTDIEGDTVTILNKFSRYIFRAMQDLTKEKNLFLAAEFESLYRGPLGHLEYLEMYGFNSNNVTLSKQQYEEVLNEKIKSLPLYFGDIPIDEEVINEMLRVEREFNKNLKEKKANFVEDLIEEYKDYQHSDDFSNSINTDDDW